MNQKTAKFLKRTYGIEKGDRGAKKKIFKLWKTIPAHLRDGLKKRLKKQRPPSV